MSAIVPNPHSGKSPLGVWLHSLSEVGNRDEMCRMVERMVGQGVDILFACVKQTTGAADYPSSVACQSEWSRGRDPLQELVDASKDVGLKVHAWFCVFPEGGESNLIHRRPELQAVRRDPATGGIEDGVTNPVDHAHVLFACVNHPDVHDYEYRMMKEVIDRYDLDGIHFDWIRSGYHLCYCGYCRQKCRELTGADLVTELNVQHPKARLWYDFRAANVTGVVRRVADAAHASGMKTSAAVFCVFPLSYNEQGQDWPLWLQDGLVDVAIPMTYFPNPREVRYYTLNHVAQRNAAGRGELWEGLGCYAGMGEVDEQALSDGVRAALEAGASGIVVFEYRHITDARFAAIRSGIAAAAPSPA